MNRKYFTQFFMSVYLVIRQVDVYINLLLTYTKALNLEIINTLFDNYFK